MESDPFDGAPSPASAGFDARRLAAVDTVLEDQIRRGRLPGAVTLTMRRGVLAGFSALGRQDPARGLPMHRDSIFRIFSMTKPIVSVALLRLVEEGRLLLGDPVARHLPEFGAVQVHVEVDGACRRVAPSRPITVHDLLRHTAGLTYEFLEPATTVRRLYVEAGLPSSGRSNAEHCRALAGLPLVADPGSAWEYSRATDVVGRLVEVVAGESLGEHLRRVVFEPLGMVDTAFEVPAHAHGRLAEPFATDPDGGGPVALGDPRRPEALESGGGGLKSTAADYARFLSMLLRRGSGPGARVLGRKTIEWMTSDHLGAIPQNGDLLPPGHGFGLGVAVRLARGLAAIPGSVGTYGWGGIAGTLFFVDPQEELIAILMIQAPVQRIEIQTLFRTMVYAALDD